MTIKKLGKAWLSRRLEKQVIKLRDRNDFKVVAVVGSVGKTTTKLAIAQLLGGSLRVCFQSGNYNDRVTVPLVFFEQQQPAIFNIPAWIKVLSTNAKALHRPYNYDVVVVELGTDGPGQMQQFAYIKPDIAIVTALTAEHMEYFKTIEAVAQEELTVTDFAALTVINVDDSPPQLTQGKIFKSYGFTATDYLLTHLETNQNGTTHIRLQLQHELVQLQTTLLGMPGAKAVAAAAIVGELCGLDAPTITANAAAITAMPGRMQLLNGQNGAVLIDDSYNSSPAAVKASLHTLYQLPQTRKIALLGSMNEMGVHSADMHAEVGSYCDPSKLELVITLGADANRFLAQTAQQLGCQVKSFDSPYEAGTFLQQYMTADTVVLIKGSQNRVFSEEAIKSLLADPTDARKLVRQSDYWLNIKRQQFKAV